MHVYHQLLTAWKLETRLAQAYRVCELWCCDLPSHTNLSDRGHKMLALLSGMKIIWLEWKRTDLFPKPVWPVAGFLCRVHKPVRAVQTILWEQMGPRTLTPWSLSLCPCHHSCSPPSSLWHRNNVLQLFFHILLNYVFPTEHLIKSV